MIISLTSSLSPDLKRHCALHACLTGFFCLSGFAPAGDALLTGFGITIGDVQVGGGLILMLFGLQMTGARPGAAPAELRSAGGSSPGVSPLGIPLLAGPGAISTSIVYADVHPRVAHNAVVIAAIASACVITYIAFRTTLFFGNAKSETIASLVNRVSGLIIVANAMPLLSSGIQLQYGMSS